MNYIETYGYIDFRTIKEDWSEYLLEDKTYIRLKIVPLKIIKKPSGIKIKEGIFFATFSPRRVIEDVTVSDHKNGDVGTKELKIIILKDEWNEYELSNGIKIKSKPLLKKVISTGQYDPEGDPSYIIEVEALYEYNSPLDNSSF